MYIRNGRACVIVNNSDTGSYYASNAFDALSVSPAESTSRVVVVDVMDKTRPVILDSFDLNGEVTDSRIVGNILYVVSSERPACLPYYKAESEENGGTAHYIHVSEKAIFVENSPEDDTEDTTTIIHVDISNQNFHINRHDLSITTKDESS